MRRQNNENALLISFGLPTYPQRTLNQPEDEKHRKRILPGLKENLKYFHITYKVYTQLLFSIASLPI